MIVEAAQKSDPVALEALRKIGTFLGVGIDSLIKVFNPEAVVFGGILSVAGEFLLPAIKEELKKRWLLENASDPRLLLADSGSEAAAMGGIAKILQTVLANPPI